MFVPLDPTVVDAHAEINASATFFKQSNFSSKLSQQVRVEALLLEVQLQLLHIHAHVIAVDSLMP